MRAILPLLATILFAPILYAPILYAQGLVAGELVMFESPICEYCEMWHEEAGIIYDKTSEARLATLRRVDIHDERPAGLETLGPIIYTPTFVLMSGGREVGRILGYPGEAHFWGLLDGLLTQIDTRVSGCPAGTALASNAVNSKDKSSC